MSLENQITELTAAINRLAETFNATARGTAGPATTTSTLDVKVAKEAAKPTTTKKVAVKVEEPLEAPQADESGADSVTFEDVAAAIRKLGVVRDRDTVLGILKEFKAAKGSDIKPTQYVAFMERANALMTEVDEPAEEDLAG